MSDRIGGCLIGCLGNSGGRMRKSLTALAAVAAIMLASGVKAEDWPTRPLTMVNPFAAGGPNDVVARLVAQRMGGILGQSILIQKVGRAGRLSGAHRGPKTATHPHPLPQGAARPPAPQPTP